MSAIGIIGGSGLYEIEGFELKKKRRVTTPYGKPSDSYLVGSLEGRELVFLPRHGKAHKIPPHMINYRANIWGFRELGADRIISVSATGGIKKGLKPGDIVVLDQVLDMTHGRKSTFYDGKEGVIHVDFTEPFCPEMRKVIVRAGRKTRVSVKNGGTYVAVNGPRLESAAEIRSFAVLGGDVVGMTGMPEAALAREIEICYAGVTVVANYAAGISRTRLTVAEVMEAMKKTTNNLKKLLRTAILMMPEDRGCPCGETLKEAKV
jgi:5'-methylthioadenosine phosphorylase